MADYTCSTSNYYNSSNTSGGAGYYFGSNRKVRLTISDNSWLTGKTIRRAYLSMAISGYWNKDTLVYHLCSTSSAVSTVFPNKSMSGAVYDYVEKPAKLCFYPVKTYHFDITKLLQYAQANYTGTWYLWQFFSNNDGTGRKYSAPTITIETTLDGIGNSACYVHDGTSWKPAIPMVYDGGWKAASGSIYTTEWKSNGTWATKTWPSASQGAQNTDIASASSVYADHSTYYKPICPLGASYSYGWMSSNSATGPWIQIHLPEDAYDLQVTIYNSSGNSRRNNGPLTGSFYYTNRHNMESNETNMLPTGVTFSRPDGLTKSASTTHSIGNTYPIRNILIKVDTWEKSSSYGFCCIGRLSFTYKYKS